MEQFPHLKFVQKLIGKPRLWGGGKSNPISDRHREDRLAHSTNLSQSTNQVKANWDNGLAIRQFENLAPLDGDVIPVFLQINPDLFNADFDLQAFGIEIVSEEDNGFIIGASVDKLKSLEEKINSFIDAGHGSARVADLWQIIEGNREEWKPRHILCDSLYTKWNEIEDDRRYAVEIGIAFDVPLGPEPDVSKKGGLTRLEKYRNGQIEREERLRRRETDFENFIKHYGEITSGLVGLEDSFGCEVNISGKGLKDLVFNYPFVFEVNELEEIAGTSGEMSEEEDNELNIVAPDYDAPTIGVIDSGIMENHRLLEEAMDGNSKSYLHTDTSVADHVTGGGHGTRVAGAILYPLGISRYVSPYQLPCFIRNLRALDNNNQLPHKYPAELMQDIVDENPDCKVYNLSVNSTRTHRKKHMSTWATSIDKKSFEDNVLFIVSAGNISRDTIREYINVGTPYPTFLEKSYCGIANPGQSCFAITVGSINHAAFDDQFWQSLGNENEISAFSRIGPGIWNTIKPDLVEFGGGLIISKNNHNVVKHNNVTAPELLRSVLHGGGFNGRDNVGTSFAAPKVTNIASTLKRLYPNETNNLLRALLVQGARLPNNQFVNPTEEGIRFFGYGIPSAERVIRNTEHRISLYTTGEISAEEGHVYSLKIPAALRNPGDDFDILIEVSLAYTADVRRTRQKVKSYLSTWLDWANSKIGETIDQFEDYALKEVNGVENEYDNEERNELPNMHWKIGNRANNGEVNNYTRSNNTIQKDWTIIKSNELTEEIGFVVRGHKGWDKSHKSVPYAFVVSIESLGSLVPIYESIRIENDLEIEID